MCDITSSPWREYFTGPPCRCGVPTAGNDEEQKIDEFYESLAAIDRRQKERDEHNKKFEEYKKQRYEDLNKRHNSSSNIQIFQTILDNI